MNNVIEELFYGNINPSDKTFKKNREYCNIANKLETLELQLMETLNEQEKILFIEFCEKLTELNETPMLEYFKSGFNLGFKLAQEIE